MVLYEYPFNESIRTMLRLEHLFDRLGQLMARDTALDHHYALATIFEVMDVASRADLKADLLKDLEEPPRREQISQSTPKWSYTRESCLSNWYLKCSRKAIRLKRSRS